MAISGVPGLSGFYSKDAILASALNFIKAHPEHVLLFLLPAYWAAVILVAAVFALPGIGFARVSVSEFLVNLTMLQTPLGFLVACGVFAVRQS